MFKKLLGTNLPIFSYETKTSKYYYTPGFLIRVQIDKISYFENGIYSSHDVGEKNHTRAIVEAAIRAKNRHDQLIESKFEPKCLTIYLNQKCTLDCQYCFSDVKNVQHPESVTHQAIYAALELVSDYCVKGDQPLTVVYHGGGEPTLSWKTIERIQPFINQLCDEKNLIPFRYISTNGVMSQKRAEWLSKSVDKVGLSCDGPPEIQRIQRPVDKGEIKDSSFFLKRTGKILNHVGIPLQVRVTLTKRSYFLQEEICEYICREFHPEAIHVEPVYLGGKTVSDSVLQENDIDSFVESFSRAREIAKSSNTTWDISGMRLDDIHMAYCNIFRQVLQLVPGNIASACFKIINNQQAERMSQKIGWLDPKSSKFILDYSKINELQRSYNPLGSCQDCFIKYQCSHNCPNGCPLNGTISTDFLCKLYQRIAFEELQQFMIILDESNEPISSIKIK